MKKKNRNGTEMEIMEQVRRTEQIKRCKTQSAWPARYVFHGRDQIHVSNVHRHGLMTAKNQVGDSRAASPSSESHRVSSFFSFFFFFSFSRTLQGFSVLRIDQMILSLQGEVTGRMWEDEEK